MIWSSVLPNEYIVKVHHLVKFYPDAIFRYTYNDNLVTFSKKYTERKLKQEKVELDNKEEHIEKIVSGEKSDINKVGYIHNFN